MRKNSYSNILKFRLIIKIPLICNFKRRISWDKKGCTEGDLIGVLLRKKVKMHLHHMYEKRRKLY